MDLAYHEFEDQEKENKPKHYAKRQYQA